MLGHEDPQTSQKVITDATTDLIFEGFHILIYSYPGYVIWDLIRRRLILKQNSWRRCYFKTVFNESGRERTKKHSAQMEHWQCALLLNSNRFKTKRVGLKSSDVPVNAPVLLFLHPRTDMCVCGVCPMSTLKHLCIGLLTYVKMFISVPFMRTKVINLQSSIIL